MITLKFSGAVHYLLRESRLFIACLVANDMHILRYGMVVLGKQTLDGILLKFCTGRVLSLVFVITANCTYSNGDHANSNTWFGLCV